MLGFPGGEGRFALLSEFLDELQFDQLGAFIYPEAGTRGQRGPAVPPEVAGKRDQIMRQQRAITRAKNIQRIGRQKRSWFPRVWKRTSI